MGSASPSPPPLPPNLLWTGTHAPSISHTVIDERLRARMQLCPEEGLEGELRNHVARALGAGAPRVIRGGAKHWPAVGRWTIPFLAALRGTPADVSVDVALSNEECRTTMKVVMLLSEFAERVAARTPADGKQLYVKQVNVAYTLPDLQRDIPCDVFPELAALTTYFWAGPSGSVTGFHNDDEDNALVVLDGAKQVIMLPPSAAPILDVNAKYDSGTLCCDADPLCVDAERHAELLGQSVTVAVLYPGDVLVLPKDWFHHVYTLQTGTSVNIFAALPWDLLMRGPKRWLLQALHAIGLFKRGNCVCHA